MPKNHDIPPLTRTDKLCGLALVGILVLTTVCYELTDGAALRSPEAADKPPTITMTAPDIDWTALVKAMEDRRVELYWETVPLDQECQEALGAACEAHGVPICLALGLIEVESGFDPEADNGLCYGLCQLNKRYYPADLTPAENIRAGMAHLGKLLERYGDTEAALTAYNAGRDTGSRTYANAVLKVAEKWREELEC